MIYVESHYINIEFEFDSIKTSITLPNKFRRFKNIQILASILINNNGYIDLLSNHIWYKRSRRLILEFDNIIYRWLDRMSVTSVYPRDAYMIRDQNDNEVCEWSEHNNLRFNLMHHHDKMEFNVNFATYVF